MPYVQANPRRQYDYTSPNAPIIQHIVDEYNNRRRAVNRKVAQMRSLGATGMVDRYGNALVNINKLQDLDESQKESLEQKTELIPLTQQQQDLLKSKRENDKEVENIRNMGANYLKGVTDNDTDAEKLANVSKELVDTDALNKKPTPNAFNDPKVQKTLQDARDLLAEEKVYENNLQRAMDVGNQQDVEKAQEQLNKFLDGRGQDIIMAESLVTASDKAKEEASNNGKGSGKVSKKRAASVSQSAEGKLEYTSPDLKLQQGLVTTSIYQQGFEDTSKHSTASLIRAGSLLSLTGIPDSDNPYFRELAEKEEFLRLKNSVGTKVSVKQGKLETTIGKATVKVQAGADSKVTVNAGNIRNDNSKKNGKQYFGYIGIGDETDVKIPISKDGTVQSDFSAKITTAQLFGKDKTGKVNRNQFVGKVVQYMDNTIYNVYRSTNPDKSKFGGDGATINLTFTDSANQTTETLSLKVDDYAALASDEKGNTFNKANLSKNFKAYEDFVRNGKKNLDEQPPGVRAIADIVEEDNGWDDSNLKQLASSLAEMHNSNLAGGKGGGGNIQFNGMTIKGTDGRVLYGMEVTGADNNSYQVEATASTGAKMDIVAGLTGKNFKIDTK